MNTKLAPLSAQQPSLTAQQPSGSDAKKKEKEIAMTAIDHLFDLTDPHKSILLDLFSSPPSNPSVQLPIKRDNLQFPYMTDPHKAVLLDLFRGKRDYSCTSTEPQTPNPTYYKSAEKSTHIEPQTPNPTYYKSAEKSTHTEPQTPNPTYYKSAEKSTHSR